MIIDDITLTEEHVGRFLTVVKTGSNTCLPVGFKAKILGIPSDYEKGLWVEDSGGVGSEFELTENELASGDYKLTFAEKVVVKTSTKSERKAAAKKIRGLVEELNEAVSEAQSKGLVVDINLHLKSITYVPPVEDF